MRTEEELAKRREEKKRHYEKHKEKVKAKARDYYHANREKVQAYREENREHRLEVKRLHREKTLEQRVEYGKQYREKNKEALKAYKDEYMKRYYAENRSDFIARNKERLSQQIKATPQWADQAKIKEFYAAADFLGMVTGEGHHVDHIVPLRSKIVCGLHTEQNLQVLPASDNLRKSNRHWPDSP